MKRSLAAIVLASFCLASGAALAQEIVVRIVVAFPAGGPVDFVAPRARRPARPELDARVIIENKPGAQRRDRRAERRPFAADGTTLWLTSVGAAAINPVLYDKLAYDMQRDFVPVSLVVNNDEMLVVQSPRSGEQAARVRRECEEGDRSRRRSRRPASAASRTSRWSSSPTRPRRTCCTFRTKARRRRSPTSGRTGRRVLRRHSRPHRSREGRQAQGDRHRCARRHPLFPDVPTLAEQGLARRRHQQLVCALRAVEDTARTSSPRSTTRCARRSPRRRSARSSRQRRRADRVVVRRSSRRSCKRRHREVGQADPGQEDHARVSRRAEHAPRLEPAMTATHPAVEPGTRPELAQIERPVARTRGTISPFYRALLNSPPIAAGWEKLLTAVRNEPWCPLSCASSSSFASRC